MQSLLQVNHCKALKQLLWMVGHLHSLIYIFEQLIYWPQNANKSLNMQLTEESTAHSKI